MDDRRIEETPEFTDYLTGETTSENKARFEQALIRSSEEAWIAKQLLDWRTELQRGPVGEAAADLALRFEQVAERFAGETARTPKRTGLRSRFLPPNFLRISATVGIVAMAIVALVVWHFPLSRETGAFREYVTDRGARTTLRLPDGTSVVLGAASKLRYQPFSPHSERAVYLEGEAYFTVSARSKEPFVVYTEHTATQVLGTEFAVRAYAQDSLARVVVRSGKVAFRPRGAAAGSGMTLISGDLGLIDATGLITDAHSVPVEAYTNWTEGKLTFRNVTLREAVRDIERWYDIKVQLSDSTLASAKLVGILSAQSADEAIQLIADVLHLRVARDGQLVTFFPQEP